MSEQKVGSRAKKKEKRSTKRADQDEIINKSVSDKTSRARSADSLPDKIMQNRKSLIMMGVSLVALVIVVAVILAVSRKPVDSSFFHDSENKIVLTMDRDTASIEESQYEPYITHTVYYHDGNKITNAEVYYEYESEEVAKKVYDLLEPSDFSTGKKRDGRFVVFQVDKSKYAGMTVAEMKEEIELLKQIDALILDYNEKTLEKYGKWYMPTTE